MDGARRETGEAQWDQAETGYETRVLTGTKGGFRHQSIIHHYTFVLLPFMSPTRSKTVLEAGQRG